MIFDPLASSSHGNAYVVSDGHTSILLECGIPFRKLQKALGFHMGDIIACFVSHEHKDHAHSHLDLIKSGRLPETATQPKTVLTPDTQTVKTP